MSKMIIMQGLPASGKTTEARKIMEASGNYVRINKDLLRSMLHFSKFTFKNEDVTRIAAKSLARSFLMTGHCIIIDDTNLNGKTFQTWKDLAMECNAPFEVKRVDTPYDECIRRDALRPDSVGKDVIMRMAMQNDLIGDIGPVVLCDLDGTLCDCEHRRHWLDGAKKDWKGFFSEMSKDPVREEVREMLMSSYYLGYKIIFVSARPEDYRKETEEWLLKNWGDNYFALIMRPSGDSRPDTIVKKEMHEKYLKKLDIQCVYDDRPSIVQMWKDLGLNVTDVGDGREF